MAFRLGDRIYKEILYFYAEDLTSGNPLYVLTQLNDASIEVSAESTDVTDKNGNLVKKVWKSKSGTFNATNAFVNTNIIAAASGNDAIFASDGETVEMPKMMVVKAGTETITLPDYDDDYKTSVKVAQYFGDGSIGKVYALGTSASETEFAVSSAGVLSLPTDTTDTDTFFVRYTRVVEEGSLIVNSADKFPSTVRAIVKATYFNPCRKNEILADYIEFPSFQPSPETTIPINADSATMDFSGDLEIDYCGTDKTLYKVYSASAVDGD